MEVRARVEAGEGEDGGAVDLERATGGLVVVEGD